MRDWGWCRVAALLLMLLLSVRVGLDCVIIKRVQPSSNLYFVVTWRFVVLLEGGLGFGLMCREVTLMENTFVRLGHAWS